MTILEDQNNNNTAKNISPQKKKAFYTFICKTANIRKFNYNLKMKILIICDRFFVIRKRNH